MGVCILVRSDIGHGPPAALGYEPPRQEGTYDHDVDEEADQANTRSSALAHHLNPIIQVGKNDLSDAAVKQADETIEKRELIKCDVLDGSGLTAKEAGEELAERLGAELVQHAI